MPETQRNAELNQLLVDLSKSLLQYVGECWPWTAESKADVRAAIEAHVERQQRRTARLVQLLADRDWAIDFGTYPTEYTDLHFVALDYLLSQLVENQKWLTGEIESTRRRCADDPEAAALLGELLEEHRRDVDELEKLARGRVGGRAS